MIVWGGFGSAGLLNTGGRYNPSTDSWTATSTVNAPSVRYLHTAVWTGSEMIVWGGIDPNTFYLNTGGRYNPGTNSWTATSTTNAPSARGDHTAVWIGSEMIVWGGLGSARLLNTGGRYNPTTNSWTATSTTNAPPGRENHTAVWTGSEMIVWGGQNDSGRLNTGRQIQSQHEHLDGYQHHQRALCPSTTIPQSGRPEMIVWGGGDGLPAQPRRSLRCHHGYDGSPRHNTCARCSRWSHSSLDRQRYDHLGWWLWPRRPEHRR